jgi:predicted N-acetyltransferase YhbS
MKNDEKTAEFEGFETPRVMRREDIPAVYRLHALCFPHHARFADEEVIGPAVASYEPPERGGVHMLCCDGEPISKVGVFHGRVSLCGVHLDVASIGDVATHPDYQRRGLATRLLAHCKSRLTEEGARLMLVSGMGELYTRAGCVTAQDHALFTLKTGQAGPGGEEDGIQVHRLAATDLPACAQIYHAEPVHFVRDLEAFTQHPFFAQQEPFLHAEDWVIQSDGRPVAYLFLTVPWEHWPRRDTGVRDVFEYAGSRVALVQSLPQVMAHLGLKELRLLVPWQDVDLFWLLRQWAAAPIGLPLVGHTMRVVNFPGLMADLEGYVRARVPARQRRGLRFEQEEERYAIARGEERIELDGGEMTRLVMGLPAEMVSGSVAASGTASSSAGPLSRIVSALFPLPSFVPGLNYR